MIRNPANMRVLVNWQQMKKAWKNATSDKMRGKKAGIWLPALNHFYGFSELLYIFVCVYFFSGIIPGAVPH